MRKQADVSIVMVNWNSTADTLNSLASIYRWPGSARSEIIIVDNASTDKGVPAIRQRFPEVRVLESAKNLGFAGGNNLALPHLQGRHVLFLNPDTLLKNDAVSMFSSFLDAHPQAGSCGGRLVKPDGAPAVSYGSFPTAWHIVYRTLGLKRLTPQSWAPVYGRSFDNGSASPFSVHWISGANLCVRRSLLEACGGFDEDYFFLFEEVDLCYRIHQRGFLNYLVPQAEICHLGGNSFSTAGDWFRIYFYTSEFVFVKKHFGHPGWVYALNLLQWTWQYIKRTIRKRHKRRTYELLIKNMRTVLRGQRVQMSAVILLLGIEALIAGASWAGDAIATEVFC